MRRLTVILTGADPDRFRDVLQVAAAWAALERPARLYLQGEAVALVTGPMTGESDARHRCAGQPTLAELYEEARALGVSCIACQTGLTLSGTRADTLPAGVEVGGLVSLLADAGDDQLLLA